MLHQSDMRLKKWIFFKDFQDKMKTMMADLKSASKMRWTIREDILKNQIFSQIFFFSGFWSEKSSKIPTNFFFFRNLIDFSIQKPEKIFFRK